MEQRRSRTVSPARSPPGSGPGYRGTNPAWSMRGLPPTDTSRLHACAMCGVTEVYRMGGAHAVAALAYGTESVPRVDVIAGPGNLWVQEAKRLVSGDVGIDGFAGPSDVLIIAAQDADPALVAIDLLAQAEHGDGTICVAVSDDDALLDDVAARLAEAEDTGAVIALVGVPDVETALALSEAFAKVAVCIERHAVSDRLRIIVAEPDGELAQASRRNRFCLVEREDRIRADGHNSRSLSPLNSPSR